MNLTPAEITLINSKNEVRLELYKYLALHYAYPFSQGTILIQELIDYVKFVLQYFANHLNAIWQDYYNDYLATPCTKIKSIVNNPQMKIKIDSLKEFSLTAVRDERGYHQDKSGNITPAALNGAHHVDFMIGTNSLGGIHNHTLNGDHIFSPRDILTFLSFCQGAKPDFADRQYGRSYRKCFFRDDRAIGQLFYYL
ncbi:hypothetical protein [uncultured Chryseobacterium sp.]|uniref:hypothetical protein n=1 Tax=uncultured Chryseobacterium sp. TaxID=259322 RepID=UPI0025DFE6DE|nr:hypothetical protein [uncultured Chryseobacterium sp.]